MSSLADAPEGSKVVVEHVAWGGCGLRRRLMEMGLTPGTTVEVLNNSRGPVVIRVRGVVVALGRGMASRIMVRMTDG